MDCLPLCEQCRSTENLAQSVLRLSLGITLLCLLCASWNKCSLAVRVTLWSLGLLFLLLQGIFWGAATAYGNATGGGVDATWWHNIMVIAACVFLLWSFIILLTAKASEK